TEVIGLVGIERQRGQAAHPRRQRAGDVAPLAVLIQPRPRCAGLIAVSAVGLGGAGAVGRTGVAGEILAVIGLAARIAPRAADRDRRLAIAAPRDRTDIARRVARPAIGLAPPAGAGVAHEVAVDDRQLALLPSAVGVDRAAGESEMGLDERDREEVDLERR